MFVYVTSSNASRDNFVDESKIALVAFLVMAFWAISFEIVLNPCSATSSAVSFAAFLPHGFRRGARHCCTVPFLAHCCCLSPLPFCHLEVTLNRRGLSVCCFTRCFYPLPVAAHCLAQKRPPINTNGVIAHKKSRHEMHFVPAFWLIPAVFRPVTPAPHRVPACGFQQRQHRPSAATISCADGA